MLFAVVTEYLLMPIPLFLHCHFLSVKILLRYGIEHKERRERSARERAPQ
jgi:hypothetical protein